ncbi:MAG TPA: metalloregulator ArsR/SmtB family transcription factor [Anaerolineaceae bacterium]|nr:metalloregulator ArsR/SmtB family transcription factor [Anaerolineaceae bacterium]
MNEPPALEKSSSDARAQLLKALAHPVRLAILEALHDGEHCVCHLEAHLGYRQAYISQQLSVLREAGLIEDRRDGWNVFYRVIEPRIYDVLAALRQILPADKGTLANEIACPCPQCSSESK